MAKVFNIQFSHNGHMYTALVSVGGRQEAAVRVTTTDENIQVILPTGRLIFSIAEVLQRLFSAEKQQGHPTMYITENILLDLLTKD